MNIVIDSYTWNEIFLGTQKGGRPLAAIEEADEVLTPDIVLSEVARKYMREGADENKAVERLKTISETSEILGIDAATPIFSTV